MKTRICIGLIALSTLATDANAATLVGHYPFDNINLGVTPDTTGTSDGVINGGITTSPSGVVGGSLSFSGGTGEFVGISDPADGQTAFSASFWMQPTTPDLQGPVGHWNHPTGDRTILIRTGSTGELEIFADQTSGGQIGGGGLGLGAVSATSFNHVAITYDGQNLRSFLNGVESGVVRSFGSPVALGELQFGTLAIGGRGGSERDYTGLIDEVAFFQDQLDVIQINALMSLAQEPSLTYDADQVNQLLEAFAAMDPTVTIDGLEWTLINDGSITAPEGETTTTFIDGLPSTAINLGGGNGFAVVPVPEPSSLLLSVFGFAGVVSAARRRRFARSN